MGVGVDIVKIERFKKYEGQADSRFMQRVFTARERERLAEKKAQSIAGLFAAKEAVAKALGTGFSGFSPCDIEILHKENGAPYAVLHKGAKKTARRIVKRARRFCVKISISHTETDAIAYAIIGVVQFP
ncbi:MAG: holo-ACP synthase [Defluviitaleaceae bacterium]|nr:holo-ACP synthase [Defluviitaleaceae bacterium]MCL2262180.1 holo-ACP synthase [Defluviitaleaceae bacterium]